MCKERKRSSSLDSLLRRKLIKSDLGPTFMTLFNLNYFGKGPNFKYIVTSVGRASTFKFCSIGRYKHSLHNREKLLNSFLVSPLIGLEKLKLDFSRIWVTCSWDKNTLTDPLNNSDSCKFKLLQLPWIPSIWSFHPLLHYALNSYIS